MVYVCVLCASCGSSQCCILHDLQFVNAGQGWKKRPYGRGILQSRSHDCFIGSHECLLLFTPSCCCECFYYLLCLVCLYWDGMQVCVLYVSSGSKVKPRTFGCIAMRSAVLFMFRSRLLLYSAGYGLNIVQVVLSGVSVRLCCFVKAKLYVGMLVCISWLHSCVCVDVMVMSSA